MAERKKKLKVLEQENESSPNQLEEEYSALISDIELSDHFKDEENYVKVDIFSIEEELHLDFLGDIQSSSESKKENVQIDPEIQSYLSEPETKRTRLERSKREVKKRTNLKYSTIFYNFKNHQQLIKIGNSYWEDYNNGERNFAVTTIKDPLQAAKTLVGLGSYFQFKWNTVPLIMTINMDVYFEYFGENNFHKKVSKISRYYREHYEYYVFQGIEFVAINDLFYLSKIFPSFSYSYLLNRVAEERDLVLWDIPPIQNIKDASEIFSPVMFTFKRVSIIVSTSQDTYQEIDETKEYFDSYGLTIKGLMVNEKQDWSLLQSTKKILKKLARRQGKSRPDKRNIEEDINIQLFDKDTQTHDQTGKGETPNKYAALSAAYYQYFKQGHRIFAISTIQYYSAQQKLILFLADYFVKRRVFPITIITQHNSVETYKELLKIDNHNLKIKNLFRVVNLSDLREIETEVAAEKFFNDLLVQSTIVFWELQFPINGFAHSPGIKETLGRIEHFTILDKLTDANRQVINKTYLDNGVNIEELDTFVVNEDGTGLSHVPREEHE